MYYLIFENSENRTRLRLENNKTIIRQWCGKFAELIFHQQFTFNRTPVNFFHFMHKNQVQKLFLKITCLHQKLLCRHDIEKDLGNPEVSESVKDIAKSLLLQLRINSEHPEYDELLHYYIDEFHNYDTNAFESALNLLIENNLIQKIHTEDGRTFFDKNTQPHHHIYFSKQQKLIDCNNEIADFLMTRCSVKQLNHIIHIKMDAIENSSGQAE